MEQPDASLGLQLLVAELPAGTERAADMEVPRSQQTPQQVRSQLGFAAYEPGASPVCLCCIPSASWGAIGCLPATLRERAKIWDLQAAGAPCYRRYAVDQLPSTS